MSQSGIGASKQAGGSGHREDPFRRRQADSHRTGQSAGVYFLSLYYLLQLWKWWWQIFAKVSNSVFCFCEQRLYLRAAGFGWLMSQNPLSLKLPCSKLPRMSAPLHVSWVLTSICSNMYHMSLPRVRRPPLPSLSPTYAFYSATRLPLTFPISQHSWAVPHQSKGQFMGLMLQRVQTGLWDRMFGWYLALLKQTSPQNMITEGKEGPLLLSYLISSRPH